MMHIFSWLDLGNLKFDGSGLFTRWLVLADTIGLGFVFPIKLRQLDARIFSSMNLFVRARKITDSASRPSATDAGSG